MAKKITQILILTLYFTFSISIPLGLGQDDDIANRDFEATIEDAAERSISEGNGGSMDDLLDSADVSKVGRGGEDLSEYMRDAGVEDSDFSGICDKTGKEKPYLDYPECAASPAECGTNANYFTPLNCLFLEEPIGGETGYDLYKISCFPHPKDGKRSVCSYTLWHGSAITSPSDRGPVQAILAYEKGKEYQGPFGLLYNYISLIYDFMSGIIIAFVVMISIIGGIRMSTSYGNSEQFGKGKSMIVKAIIGMALWFMASLILYTINPTFFSF